MKCLLFGSIGKGVSILSLCYILLQGKRKDSSNWREAYVVEPREFTWSFCTRETNPPSSPGGHSLPITGLDEQLVSQCNKYRLKPACPV